MGYDVYRGTTAGGPYTLLNSTAVPATTFTDTTGQVGQTYYYVVTAVDSSDVQSGYSNAVSATIP
jgi:fibronectin type 3 domain-containing protein